MISKQSTANQDEPLLQLVATKQGQQPLPTCNTHPITGVHWGREYDMPTDSGGANKPGMVKVHPKWKANQPIQPKNHDTHIYIYIDR